MPTVFLSAATVDLEEWREALHGAFSRAGFRVLTQKRSFGVATGGVKQLLTKHIDESDCVIHLAGMGYGWDADNPFPEAPQFVCSWTQFEYYYAHSQNKDVIAFVCAPNLSKPGFADDGDAAERARKAGLQEAHRDRVTRGRFDGTPLASKVQRTCNETVDSVRTLVQSVAAAVKALHRPEPEWQRVRDELTEAIARVSAGVGRANEKLDEVLRILKGSDAPAPGAATLRVKWPDSWSHFRIGGTQTIRWEAFVEPGATIAGFELELHLEERRVLTICGADAHLAGDVRAYSWKAPADLLDGHQYRVRLLARDGEGHLSETFSAPFTLRAHPNWEFLGGVGALLGAALGLNFGGQYLAPLLFGLIAEDPRYYNDNDPLMSFLRFIVRLPGERCVTGILTLIAAETLASLLAVAAMMMISWPATFVILTLAVGGGAGGYLINQQVGLGWGGLIGIFLGVSTSSEFFRGQEDIEVVLKANADLWKWIGGLILSLWKRILTLWSSLRKLRS